GRQDGRRLSRLAQLKRTTRRWELQQKCLPPPSPLGRMAMLISPRMESGQRRCHARRLAFLLPLVPSPEDGRIGLPLHPVQRLQTLPTHQPRYPWIGGEALEEAHERPLRRDPDAPHLDVFQPPATDAPYAPAMYGGDVQTAPTPPPGYPGQLGD